MISDWSKASLAEMQAAARMDGLLDIMVPSDLRVILMRLAEYQSAVEFMLMAWDGDAGYRHHCGVGDDVTFPICRGKIQSVAAARALISPNPPPSKAQKDRADE